VGEMTISLLVCHFHEGQMKICTYNNINKWHNKQHWNTHILLYTITVSNTDRINLPLYHTTTLCLLSKVFTHYFKEAMFSHWTMSVCSRCQYKSHSNEDNYSVPYQNIGTARPLLSAYSMQLSFQHFFKFTECTCWKLWHLQVPQWL